MHAQLSCFASCTVIFSGSGWQGKYFALAQLGRQHTPLPREPTALVGCGQVSGPGPASRQHIPVLVLFLAPAETGQSRRCKRVCGAHAAWWDIHLTVNHCNTKWQGHHLGNFSALLLRLLDALWQRAAEERWFYKRIVENYTQKAEMGTNYPRKLVKCQG